MTIIHKSGNILDATENIIIHQVNCEGVMGAGLAKQLRNKWPIIYTEYKKLCDENRIKFMLLGKVQYIKVDEKKYVANMFSQLGIGTDKIQTIYSDMKKGLKRIEQGARFDGLSIALPFQLGCNRAGGDWDGVVYPMIQEIFNISDVDVAIYTYESEVK